MVERIVGNISYECLSEALIGIPRGRQKFSEPFLRSECIGGLLADCSASERNVVEERDKGEKKGKTESAVTRVVVLSEDEVRVTAQQGRRIRSMHMQREKGSTLKILKRADVSSSLSDRSTGKTTEHRLGERKNKVECERKSPKTYRPSTITPTALTHPPQPATVLQQRGRWRTRPG